MNHASQSPRFGDRAGLLALCAAAFVSMAAMRACDPLLPAFADAFGVSTGAAASTISSFAVAYGLMQLVYGPLGDRYGKFAVVACAVSACAAGNLLAALSGDLNLLVIARALSGATAAGIIPLSLAWVGDAVAYERRQETLGHLMTATLLGTAFGQWMSGVLADTLGWRWVFGLMSLLFFSLGLSMLGMARARHASAGAGVPGVARTSFYAGMGIVLASPWARLILLITMVEGAFVMGTVAFLPAYLHEGFGLSLNGAAAVVALFAFGGLAYTMQARRMVARFGEPGLAVCGAGALGLCLVLIALGKSWMLAVPASLVAGTGFAMLHGTLQTHATQMAPSVRGTATALFGASLFLGQSLGVLAAAAAVDQSGFPPLFLVAGVVTGLLGGFFARALTSHAQRSRMAPDPG